MMTMGSVKISTILLGASALLGGCGIVDRIPPVNLAVVNGYHANAPIPATNSKTLRGLVLDSATSYGMVSIIVADGKPYVAASYSMEAPKKNISNNKKAQIALDQADQIIAVMKNAKAKTPELDTLSAISWAARGLSNSKGKKKILVVDSGLSTTGYIDFTKNLLRAEPETLVEYLQEKEALPELAGMDIVWVGLGDICGKQEPLTAANMNNLRAIWEEILYAAGAKSICFEGDYPSFQEEAELPQVTPVPVIKDLPLNIVDIKEPIVLTEEKVLFKPDTAEFADYEAAAKALRPLTEYLMSNSHVRVALAGTTATVGSNDSCKAFSLTRVDAVKALLMELGAPEKQIADVMGLGYEHKYHIPDVNADGTLNANASANRSVIIFNADSADWKELLKYK